MTKMSQVVYAYTRKTKEPPRGMPVYAQARSINAGRHPHADLLSNLGPARFARPAQHSDTKGCRAMQYCPSDSTAEERGVAERDTTKPRRGAGTRITGTRVARSVAVLSLMRRTVIRTKYYVVIHC